MDLIYLLLLLMKIPMSLGLHLFLRNISTLNYPEPPSRAEADLRDSPSKHDSIVLIYSQYQQNRFLFRTCSLQMEPQVELSLILNSEYPHSQSTLIHAKVSTYSPNLFCISFALLLTQVQISAKLKVKNRCVFSHGCF